MVVRAAFSAWLWSWAICTAWSSVIFTGPDVGACANTAPPNRIIAVTAAILDSCRIKFGLSCSGISFYRHPDGARAGGMLGRGRSASRDVPRDGTGDVLGFARCDLDRYHLEIRSRKARQLLIDRLVAQMADRAGRLGATGVVMKDAAHRQREHQQRQQRGRYDNPAS